MARPFMDENFLLNTDAARHLFHDYAEEMPIIDYHCHLSPKEIAENAPFPNVGNLFLGGDHYKWRGMSAFGYDNVFIRRSSDYERFMAYAKAMPMMIGNPLYHWTHLELQRVFGITDPLSEKNAQHVWEECNHMLSMPGFRPRDIITRFKVKLVCTTDSPSDDLRYHKALAADAKFRTKVLPAFRPDGETDCTDASFAENIRRLGETADISTHSVEDVKTALERRIDYFHAVGARVSDHGLNTLPTSAPVDNAKAERAFRAAMAGDTVDAVDAQHYTKSMLIALGTMYAKRGWVQQYHMNALRNVNTHAFRTFGANTGYDTVNDTKIASRLASLLDAQERLGTLPKTILYTLNPADNYVLAAMAGCFQGGTPGKIQFGSGWWFCDQLHGMEEQMRSLASIGLISQFIGMLTDSRSFVSYPRHEYFRRLLCRVVGEWVENGEYPEDEDALRTIIQGISYTNAKRYFGIPLDEEEVSD